MSRLPTPEALGAEFVRVLWEWIQDPNYWDGDYAECETPRQAWALMAETNMEFRKDPQCTCCASHDWCDANMAMCVAMSNFGVSPPCDDSADGLAKVELWNAAWLAAQPALANPTPPTVH